MTAEQDVNRPLAVVVFVIYVILVWLAASLFVKQQRRVQSRRSRPSPALRFWR